LAYATPDGRECYLFGQKSTSSALFCVPYTYCVEIIREDGEWYYVSYAADEDGYRQVYGYCKRSEFTRVEEPPKNIYLNKIITVSFTASDGEAALTPPPDMQVEAAYYGVYRLGADYYSYVYCQGAFCYVAGANDDYPLNDLGGEENGESDGTATREAGENNTAGLVVLLVIAGVAVTVILALLLSSKKPKDV